jgi:hypothetical protein
MAALMPILVVATLLTSGVATHVRHTLPIRSVGGKVGSVLRSDVREDATRLDLDQELQDRIKLVAAPD